MGTPPSEVLTTRLRAAGQRLGERESGHAGALLEARHCAESLHAAVEQGLRAFHQAAAEAGAPQIRIELGEVRLDEKHARSIQFDLRRGRYVAIVTVKSRGEVTLVGPFRSGKTEGPCRSFPMGSEDLPGELAGFLERFLEEAATP